MTTRDKLTFVHFMARSTRATVRQCEALMRYATTLRRMYEIEKRDGYVIQDAVKRERIRSKVKEMCFELSAYHAHGNVVPVFAGPVLKIRTPGGEEITCPS